MANEKGNSAIDKFIDFIFSKDSRKWLFLIFLLGLILRFIATANNSPVADEMVHGSHAIGISELKPLSTITQGPIWFYITDISYRIFNVHLWSGRIMSLLFGSFSIILVYLIANLFFSKRTALISAFIFAISPYQLFWARIYMDESLLFFILTATYIFLKEYQTKRYVTPLSAVFLGIGCLIKIIAGVYIVVFGIFLLYIIYSHRNNKVLFRKSIKNTIYFVLIILVCLIPLVSYNYFLYSEKKTVDLPFAMYLGINVEAYQGAGLAHGEGFMVKKLPKNIYNVFNTYFIKQDLLAFLLAIPGAFLFARQFRNEKKLEKNFILILFGFAFVFIASTIVLDTHYTYFTAFFAIVGGNALDKLSTKLSPTRTKQVLLGILIIILLVNLYTSRLVLTTKSSTEKMRSFAIENIGNNDLIVVDSRIYRGNIAWMFNDKHYVEATIFTQFMEISAKMGEEQSIHTYYIECAIDDCGWGTIKDQPEVNQTMEQITTIFKNISLSITPITGGGTRVASNYDTYPIEQYRVYETYLKANPGILDAVDKTHSFFFYEIPRNKNPTAAVDHYNTYGPVKTLLNLLAYGILYLLIFLALASPIYTFYLLYKSH